jgi:hypothetical protein
MSGLKGDIAENALWEETNDDPLQPTYTFEGERRLCRRIGAWLSGDRPRPGQYDQDRPCDAADSAIGSYAQLGVKLAAEEINQAGGIMGKQIDLMSEDSVNPATAATKAQRMLEQDGAVVLLGEISSASSLTIMQVAERNKKVFFSTGARSDALRGKSCNRYSFHCDIPNTVMVNAVGTALLQRAW